MANQSTPVNIQPELQHESSTGVRVAVRAGSQRSAADSATEELELIAGDVLEEPAISTRASLGVASPSLPPLPPAASPAPPQLELLRVTRLHREQQLYVTELETILERRSQELLEADEREAALVRRFHSQTLRIAELERQAREQKLLIEQLQAALPKRPAEASELLSVRGIGPKYARTLSALGVATIEALAALSDDDVNRIEQQLRIRNGRIRRERWVEQAQELREGVPA